MMETEFKTLSEKFPYDDMEDSKQWIKIEDVKEFIRLLKKGLNDAEYFYGVNKIIDKLAGDKLK